MRFSVISASGHGFKTLNDMSASQIADTVLDPVRMAKRLELFREIPLKSLQAQTDQKFKCIVLVSKLLGEEFKTQLRDLATQNKFLKIEEVGQDEDPAENCSKYIRQGTVTFRIDDDDAIHPAQVETLKSTAARIRPNTVISFPNGFAVGAKDEFVLFQPRRWVVNAQGIAYVSNKKRRSIFELGSHTKLDRYRMELCETPRAWMRSIHKGSDSGARITKNTPFISVLPEFMREHAPEYDFIDFERVQKLLA